MPSSLTMTTNVVILLLCSVCKSFELNKYNAILNQPRNFSVDNNSKSEVKFELRENERSQLESGEHIFQVRFLSQPRTERTVNCPVQVRLESDQNDERFPVTVNAKNLQTEAASSLSVPVVVRRGGRIMCRTSHQQRDLNAREVLQHNSSSLTLIIATSSPESINLNITVLLKVKTDDAKWKEVKDNK